MPHDEAQLILLGDDQPSRLYVATPDGASDRVADHPAKTILESVEPQLLDVVPGPDRGLRCGLTVPVSIDARVVGSLALFSSTRAAYGPGDLQLAQRLAVCLALGLDYRRLAEQARDAAAERQRSAGIEGTIELLRTIADVLDIRTVFPRISEITRTMLPHDALAMVFVDRDRHFVRQAAAPPGFPDPPFVTATTAQPKELIVADISSEALTVFEPADAFTPVIAAGYRAFLSVTVPAREQVVQLAFWSKRRARLRRTICRRRAGSRITSRCRSRTSSWSRRNARRPRP